MAERAVAAMSKDGAPDPLIGRVINDKFKILGLIAKGGMGKVYRVEQAPLGRVCALKVLNANYSGDHDPEFHKRFFLEASMTSKLRHPNTVTIFDYGRTEDGVYYMAMEYLEGYTLHRAIRQAGHFTEQRAAHIARQICRSLREAHSVGVIHRDLKPANIYLLEHGDEPDFVKVLDFGLVKNIADQEGEDLTQAGLFMGSPKYMAPEQIGGGNVDARTDIYALGVIMYEMMSGKVPFDRATNLKILTAQVEEKPPSIHELNPAAQISPALEEAIMRAMAKAPEERFRSMDEVLAALKRLGPVPVPEPSGSLTADRSSALGVSGPHTLSAMSRTGDHPAPIAADADHSQPSASAALDASPPSEAVGLPPPRSRAGLLAAAAAVGVLMVAGSIGYGRLHGSSSATPPRTPAVAEVPAVSPAAVAPPPASATGPAAPATTEAGKSIAEVEVSALSSTSKATAAPLRPVQAPVFVAPVARPVVAAPHPAEKPAAAAPAKPSADCNPSYYYDADGNKHFKPECFGR